MKKPLIRCILGLSLVASGGVKIAIAKRLRLRLDYRLFMLGDLEDGDRGPTMKYPQRFSAGLQLVF